MAAVVERRDVVPSGLTEHYKQLTRPDRIVRRTSGRLDDPDVFRRVSSWPSFRDRVAPGALVSREVAETLSALSSTTHEKLPVSLADALRWEAGDSGWLQPVQAGTVGVVITKELIDELRAGSPAQRAEHEALRVELARVRFSTRAGGTAAATELIGESDEADQDEPLRARFAPSERVLAQSYKGTGFHLFLLCRRGEQPASLDLAIWALLAKDRATRLAVLHYLARGRLSLEVAAHLRSRIAGTWLTDLLNLDLLADLGPLERNLVLAHLDQLPPIVYPSPPPPPIADAKDALERVFAWWQKEGTAQLNAYVAQTFPNGSAPELETDWERVRTDIAARKEWLRLFLLGASFTLGGVRREQHRAFVDWCESKRWLDRFAELDADGAGAVQPLMEYLEEGVDLMLFYYWMRLFVPLFQLSIWLEEYVEIFLRLRRQNSPTPLDLILTPNANPQLSGSGINAPPLRRTLGIGACFVLRELRRTGVITNEMHDDHCYVPSRPAREFLARLGCDGLAYDRPYPEMSRLIHAFLKKHLGPERARFGNAFDIPFLRLGEDPDLQVRVLEQTISEPEGTDPVDDP